MAARLERLEERRCVETPIFYETRALRHTFGSWTRVTHRTVVRQGIFVGGVTRWLARQEEVRHSIESARNYISAQVLIQNQ